jgi:hypothetical protein
MGVDSNEKMQKIFQKLANSNDLEEKVDRNKAAIEISDCLKEQNKGTY